MRHLTRRLAMKIWGIVLASVMLLTLSGCGTWFQKPNTVVPDLKTKENIVKATDDIETNQKVIDASSQTIRSEAEKIKEDASEASAKLPDETKATIDPHLERIKTGSDTIISETQKIDGATAAVKISTETLKAASKDIGTLEKLIRDLEKERDRAIGERDKAISDRDSSMHRYLQILIIACIVLAVVFGALFVFYHSKAGLMASAVCAVICAVAAFVDTYFVYMAIGGGIFLAACLGLAAWHIYIRQKALRECIETVEVAQDNLDPAKKEQLFGKDGEAGMMASIQSKSTMDLVKDFKGQMSNLWYYAKKKNGHPKPQNGDGGSA